MINHLVQENGQCCGHLNVDSTDSAYETGDLNEYRKSVANDLIELAWLQSTELTAGVLNDLQKVGFPDSLGLQLTREDAPGILSQMREAVRELNNPTPQQFDELAADYAAIYLLHTHRASPCESVWFDEDGLVYQEPMFQVREVMRHYGLQAEDWRIRSEDHLAMQLLFAAYLIERPSPQMSARGTLNDAAQFLDEHTLRWVGKFAAKISARCATRFYAALVVLTEVYLDQLRNDLAEILDSPRPAAKEIAAKFEAARMAAVNAINQQASCGPLCETREDPKPNRRRYP